MHPSRLSPIIICSLVLLLSVIFSVYLFLLVYVCQILNLAHNKSDIERRVHSVIDKFAERGLRSLAVAYQEVPEGRKESPGAPWQFIGLMPLFDPPRHDSAETIRRALNLGVSVKMITGMMFSHYCTLNVSNFLKEM